MTPATAMSPSTPRPSGSFIQITETGTDDPAKSRLITTHSRGQEFSGPDWADSQTQAEIAAELAAEQEALELYPDEEQEGEWWREDRYGTVDFDGHWDDDEKQDEADVQRALKTRGFGIGKWVDGVVDVFLKLEDDDDDQEVELSKPDPKDEAGTHEQEEDAPSSTKGPQQTQRNTAPENTDQTSDDSIEAAPEDPKSVWDDVAWFSRLVLRTARS